MKSIMLLTVISITILFTLCGRKGFYSYKEDVVPVLEDNCYECHKGNNPTGKINFENYDLLFKGKYIDKEWPVVVPGNSAESRLYLVVNSNNSGIRMPPENLGYDKLDKDEIKIIKEWIDAGSKNN